MANKIVQLVDKNSNNLYPVAGAVITDAVSTGAISSQAVTNPKIENGAVNGVENNATAIGTAKLALDTVGTPNLRDSSVTSDKIDFTTLYNNPSGAVSDFTLSEPFTNFRFIEIYAGAGAMTYCKFIPANDGQSVRLQIIHRLANSNPDNGIYLSMATLTFNGTQVTYSRYGQMTIRPSNQGGTHAEWDGTPKIGISRIIGYR